MNVNQVARLMMPGWQHKYEMELRVMDKFRVALELLAAAHGIDVWSDAPELDAYGITLQINTRNEEWGVRFYFEDKSICLVGGPVGYRDQQISAKAMYDFVAYARERDAG